MQTLVSASFIASFFAGIAALFAPCCITVLLPSYLASIFKQKSTIFFMTFIYFLGLLSVFLPIGLGATFLSMLFREYHTLIFLGGGVFLLLLGSSLVLGLQFALQSPVHPSLKGAGIGSVYMLGIFSAIATTCCAPVLAGVVTLSVLPGSIFLGGLYTLAYVMGMVVPLFVLAAFLDHAKFTQKFLAFRKTIRYSIFGRTVALSYSNLFSGVMFLGLGVFIVFLAATDQLFSHSAYQLDMNLLVAQMVRSTSTLTRLLPESVWGGVFLLLASMIGARAIFEIRRERARKDL